MYISITGDIKYNSNLNQLQSTLKGMLAYGISRMATKGVFLLEFT